MMKKMLVGALLLAGAAAYGQESRQDVSISATAPISPEVNGNAVPIGYDEDGWHFGELPLYADSAQRT